MTDQNNIKCPICSNEEFVTQNINTYTCPFCGTFHIDFSFLPKLESSHFIDDNLRLKIRYIIKKNSLNQAEGMFPQYINLTEELTKEIDENYIIPNLLAKIDLVLEYIKNKTTFFAEEITIDLNKIFPLFYCKNNYELAQILIYLIESKYIKPINFTEVKYNTECINEKESKYYKNNVYLFKDDIGDLKYRKY